MKLGIRHERIEPGHPEQNGRHEDRPHEALDDNFPASRYAPSPRTFPRRLPRIDYALHLRVRKVAASGRIRWNSLGFIDDERPELGLIRPPTTCWARPCEVMAASTSASPSYQSTPSRSPSCAAHPRRGFDRDRADTAPRGLPIYFICRSRKRHVTDVNRTSVTHVLGGRTKVSPMFPLAHHGCNHDAAFCAITMGRRTHQVDPSPQVLAHQHAH